MMARPSVPGVTLAAITSVALEATVAALRHSVSQVRFNRALLLSDVCPPSLGESGVEWRRIDRLNSRADYSRFVLRQLADHIETDHVLIVQWDGFVRDGSRWSDKFLEYDYIGAVWPQFVDERKVGNGGFSLRSKRLLEATRMISVDVEPEDISICRTNRHIFESVHKLQFAGLELARRFSYERERSCGGEFGFHGVYNFFTEMPSETMRSLVGSLEPAVLGASESVEVMFKALGRGDLKLARLCLRHVLAHPQVLKRVARGAGRLLAGYRDEWAGGGGRSRGGPNGR